MDINKHQRRLVVLKLREMLCGNLTGKVIGLLGLAFKPNTDDMRDAPALEIARAVAAAGGIVRGYDPVAMPVAARMMPQLQMCSDAYEVAEQADALVLCTDWNEFKQLDLRRVRSLMRKPVMVDGRNLYEPQRMAELGFEYRGMGRGC
jgi:UDPglucose 6-dehydrogenase